MRMPPPLNASTKIAATGTTKNSASSASAGSVAGQNVARRVRVLALRRVRAHA